MIHSSLLSLENAPPIYGFELERDGSFGTAVDIDGYRIGLFFQPANSYSNKENIVRIKMWDIRADSVFYKYEGEIEGISNFISRTLILTDKETKNKFLQSIIVK